MKCELVRVYPPDYPKVSNREILECVNMFVDNAFNTTQKAVIETKEEKAIKQQLDCLFQIITEKVIALIAINQSIVMDDNRDDEI